MPHFDFGEGKQKVTVRGFCSHPDKLGTHLEVTIQGGETSLLSLQDGMVLDRETLSDSNQGVQIYLDKNTAMILSDMLSEVAYHLPPDEIERANTIYTHPLPNRDRDEET